MVSTDDGYLYIPRGERVPKEEGIVHRLGEKEKKRSLCESVKRK